MKKFLLFGLVFLIFLSSFTSASINSELESATIIYYRNADIDISGTLIDDITGITGDGIIGSSTVTGLTGIIDEAFNFTGDTNARVDLPPNMTWTNAFTVSLWGLLDANTGSVMNLWYAGRTRYAYILYDDAVNCNDNEIAFVIRDTGNVFHCANGGTLTTGGFHHIVATYNGSGGMSIWVDGVNIANETGLNNKVLSDNDTIGNFRNTAADVNWEGLLDEFVVFNKTLNGSEIAFLFASGAPTTEQQYPYTAPIIIDESLESTFEASQTGSIISSSASFQNILDIDFNITLNNTAVWFETIGEISSNVANQAECEILVDNTDTFNSLTTRSNDGSGLIGNINTITSNFTKDIGIVNIKYQCRRSSGGGQLNYSNTELAGHILIDSFNRTINHAFNNLSFSTSSSTFSEVDSYAFIVSNLSTSDSQSQNVISSIVVNWRSVYTNNDGSSDDLNSFISINGSNCSVYPRTVSASGVGSVSGICNLNNVSANQTLNISLFASGVNANFNFFVHTTEFFTHSTQVNGSSLIGLNINSSSLIKIANFTGEDVDHANANLYVKGGFPVNSSSSTTATFQFRLTNSVNQSMSSAIISRSVGTDIGVAILQHIFSNVSVANYTVELWASCGNSNCTLRGGDFVAYVSDVSTFTSNVFNVSAFDIYDNSSISIFNVTNLAGTIFPTSTGSVNVLSDLSLDNLTVTSNNFFSQIVLNHNTSNDLNVSLSQSIIRFNAFDFVTGFRIFNFTVNDSVVSTTTNNGSAILHLQSGNNQLIGFVNGALGYFNSTLLINVSALDNVTFNFTNLFNAQFNFSAFNASGGEVLSNLSGNVSFGSFNINFSTTGTNVIVNVSRGVNGSGIDYNVFLTSRPNYTDSHSNNFRTISSNNSFQNENFTLFRDQSLFITFRDILTGNLLDNINLLMFGGTNFDFDINFSAFKFSFPVDSYDLLATKSGFSTFTQTISITEGGLVNITAFMNNDTSPISFIVRNIAGGFIEAASIKITRNSDNALIAEKFSDIFGAAEVDLNSDILYDINVTRSGFLPFFGTLNAFQSSYTITLSTADVNQQSFIGLNYQFLPSVGASLVNGTLTNFSFNVSSNGFWNLTSCTFSLLNDSLSGTIFDSNNSFCDATGGFAEFEFNTSTNTIIISRVELELNSTNNITIFRFYSINNNFQGSFSLMTFFDDLKNFGGSGFNTAGLFFMTVIVIISLTIFLGSSLTVFGEPEKMLTFTTILTGAASYLDLLNVSFTPAAFNPLGGQWIIFIVMSLLTIAAWLASPSWRLS